MSEWIGLAGVLLGVFLSGVINFFNNKQVHKNALEIHAQNIEIEDRKEYNEKREELMREFLEILPLTDSIVKHFDDYQESSNTLDQKLTVLKNSSILKAHLYFPSIVSVQDAFFTKLTEYINAVEMGSKQIGIVYSEPLTQAKEEYLSILAEPLNSSSLAPNP